MSGDRYQRTFKWIDAAAPPARREINLHSRREGQRAREWQGHRRGIRDRASLARLVGYTWRPGSGSPTASVPTSPHGDESRLAGNTSFITSTGFSPFSVFPDASSASSNCRCDEDFGYVLGDLQDVLTTSRRDPFLSLPVVNNLEDQALVDYYVVGMMSLFSKINHDMPSKTILYSLATSGPLAFQSIVLVFAATHQARMRGLEESVQSAQHKAAVIRKLRSRISGLSHGTGSDDDTIAAVFAMASFENQFGKSALAQTHVKAGMELLRVRGGSAAFPVASRLGVYANWVDYTASTPVSLHDLESFSSRSGPHEAPVVSSHSNQIDGSSDLDAFLQFLFNAEMLAVFHTHLDAVRHKYRHTMFKAGSILHRLLTPDAETQEWPSNRIPSYCRMAAIMHFHVAFWEHRMSGDLGEKCLKDLHRQLVPYHRALSLSEKGYSIHPNTSLGLLLWLMLKIDADDDEKRVPSSWQTPEGRSWFVGRILKVSKLLSYRSWLHLNRYLSSLLEMPSERVSQLDSRGEMAIWRDELKAELLSAGR